MSKLKIAVYPADHGGCGNYRLTWPALAVKKQFSELCEILIGEDVPAIRIRWDQKIENDYPAEWLNVVDATPEFMVDIMIFQRPLNKEMIKVFEILSQKGIKIIIDLDDNFDHINPRNAAWHASEPFWHTKEEAQKYADRYGSVKVERTSVDDEWFYIPKHAGRSHRKNIHECLKYADLLTCSTPQIEDTYRRGPKETFVIENYIPERYLATKPEAQSEKLTLGWTGTLATHPEDFKNVGSAISRTRRALDYNFKIVGDGLGILETLGVEPDETTGWVDIFDYPKEFASLDIIVCPLADQKFNHSKSWLKPLEAASLGVVPIMSPSSEYIALNNKGIGLIATRPREWESCINRLVKNPGLLEEMKLEGQEIASKYTIESNAWRWYETWISVV